MLNQERRNEKAHRRLNQFMQDGKTLDYLQDIAGAELNKLTPVSKDKDESESTCHSERRSRWEINDVRMNTCSRKTRNQRAVQREKLNRNFSKHYEVVIYLLNKFKSISPGNSASDMIHMSNEYEGNDQNISIKEMFNFRDLKNEEGMIAIIKEKFTQIIRDLKDTYLSNANRYFIRENFFELKRKYSNNQKQYDLIITDFFNKNIKDINEIFYQLEECYNSTIKSPEFMEKLIGPISKFFEEKNININFEIVLKEEFFNIILNDEFFKEIIHEIENRDLLILSKIKNLIRTIKEEYCLKHSNNCLNNTNRKKIIKSTFKVKAEMVTSSVSNSNTITYTRTTINNNKKAREGKIVSPVNYTVKTNITISSQQNEKEYKSISELVEYINSENGKKKKNKKKKNLSKKKKNIIKKAGKTSTSRGHNDNNILNMTTLSEIDNELEEFKRKIKNQSIKAKLVEKIKPCFSEKWLKSIESRLK